MTNKLFKPELLTDRSRLQEIYDLRAFAWEHSDKKEFVNRSLFPKGWFDNLDKDAYHWIIEDDGKIVSSARVCIVQNVTELEEDFTCFSLPKARPFAYYSRLVIHPRYRRKGFTHLMDNIRFAFLRDKQIPFALAFGSKPRKASLEKLGFIELGILQHQYSDKGKIEIDPAFIDNHNTL